MAIFDTILEKLGIKPAAAPATPSISKGDYTPASSPSEPQVSKGAYTPASSAIPMVDVVTKLNALQASFHNPELTWKVSISDLLYILKIDNSAKGLKDLAVELGCPADLMSDSAKRNMWLHTTVLQKIAANGGNIPADLLR
jgi:hypothetical protein